MNKSIIVIVYVDNILIYGRSEAEIDKLIECLKNDNIALHKEGTAEGYLGVDIQREGVNKSLKQEGLTKRIIQALGLDTKCSTPVDTIRSRKQDDTDGTSNIVLPCPGS
jgi:hypothetical protein